MAWCLQYVGPVTFDYAVVDDDKVDISISGDTTENPPTFRHMMHISRDNAQLDAEEMMRSALSGFRLSQTAVLKVGFAKK